MDEYPIPSGILSYCQGRWDEESKKFVDNNSMEVTQCCLESCVPYVKYCFQECQQTFGPRGKTPNYNAYKKCTDDCNEIIKDCEDTCWEYPSEKIKLIMQCAQDMYCGTSPIFDHKCLTREQQNIINCCAKQCVPYHAPNCEKECGDLFISLDRNRDTILSQIALPYNVNKSDFAPSRNYVLYMVVCCFVFFIIIFLTRKMKI